MNIIWTAIIKWLYLKSVRGVTKKAIRSCGLKLSRSNHWCTICHEDIYVIQERSDSYVSHSGESFGKYNVVACTCLRCRWVQMGNPRTGDDKLLPPLVDFLLKYNLDPKMLDKFTGRPIKLLSTSKN